MESNDVKRNRITFPELLGDLVWSSRTFSFSERRGLEAFDLSEERLLHWLRTRIPHRRPLVLKELEDLLGSIAVQPEEMVRCEEMDCEWTKEAALGFFRNLHHRLKGLL